MNKNAIIALWLLCAQPICAQEGPSAEAQANNPLAQFKTFNVHNQYTGALTGIDADANTVFLRGALPVSAFGGDWLVRATLPFNRCPEPASSGNVTGVGDFNVFAAYLFDTGNPSRNFGLGPQLTIPTASKDALGTEKWSAGFANVLFDMSTPGFQWGYLLTWQTSFAGSDSRSDVNSAGLQPFLFKQLGSGWYLRSTAVMTYDFETDNYNIPIGFGAGRVIKSGNATVNFFVEPQISVASRGNGQSEWGVFAGVNFQFPK